MLSNQRVSGFMRQAGATSTTSYVASQLPNYTSRSVGMLKTAVTFAKNSGIEVPGIAAQALNLL